MKKLTPVIALVLVMFGCGQQGSSAPDVDLHMAALTGNLEAIQQHIQAGSDLNLREPTRGSTPLITAIVFDKPEVAKALIDAGADINLQNNEGSTPLITAAFSAAKRLSGRCWKKVPTRQSKTTPGERHWMPSRGRSRKSSRCMTAWERRLLRWA